jgi:5-methylcytosine-specific restriction protein A
MAATIDVARAFLRERLFQPAFDRSDLPNKVKTTIKTTWSRLQQFRRPGDLLIYLDRFQGNAPPEMRDALHEASLEAFEDLRSDFRALLGSSSGDITRLSDFVIGARYTTWDILIFARVYDPRHGGIFLIPTNSPFDAIFLKATLEGGKYANQWLVPGEKLKYYFFAIKGKFGPKYKFNSAVRESDSTPIFVFVKCDDGSFTLQGIFRYVAEHQDTDGAWWFELDKRDSTSQPYQVTDQEYSAELDAKVKQASADSGEARRGRLSKANPVPRKVLVQSTNYARNADVIAEVLERANGVCEQCQQPAPFRRKSDGTPYLEVHHIIQLARDGEDTVENAIAVCPNCHRHRHFG